MEDYQTIIQKKMDIKDHFELNLFHDCLIRKTVAHTIETYKKEWGPPPSPFSFFIMGSGGRFEQGYWSDQDHGIVFEIDSESAQTYFCNLGSEITESLYQVGYKRCDGGVMANNPFWCKSLINWKAQVTNWIQVEDWESIRHLLTFVDARSFHGKRALLDHTKEVIFESISHHLLIRICENTLFQKKGVGVLGQLLVESHGPHAGTMNTKEIAFFPYVNAIRILALKEKIKTTSTLSRLREVPNEVLPEIEKEKYLNQFQRLLHYRIHYSNNSNYMDGHYLLVQNLSKEQKKEVREIIKDGSNLFQFVRKFIEKGW